jgi:predicted Rossmann fold flavoprotein
VSGGARCNVTNRTVTEHDFNGGRSAVIRRVLRAFPVGETIAFFHDLGVPLHEEALGKLFPDSNRSRDVLNALLRAVDESGARLMSGCRVLGIERHATGLLLKSTQGDWLARRVVLATGGQSLPKSGSDGAGYTFAERLGHTVVPTTPALVPLLLEDGFGHRELSGIAHDAELALWIDGALSRRITGSLLWTHFGISGPATLDMSRHWLRGQLDARQVRLTVSVRPGLPMDRVDQELVQLLRDRPRATAQGIVGQLVPGTVAAWLLRHANVDAQQLASHLTRDERRRTAHALTALELPVTGSRGFNYAEATAGGVALDEIDPSTMESRVYPGLVLVGEVLDVDGRIGGFNFQWAWASGYLGGRGRSSQVSSR